MLIAGVDEAGRGPLAGPVVAAAVIFNPGQDKSIYSDSKKLKPQKREELYQIIMRDSFSVGIGLVNQEEIDRINILQATFVAMKLALGRLKNIPDITLIDGNKMLPNYSYKQKAIVKGDDKVSVISAASIVAKVVRDRIMRSYDKIYPGYGFLQHKGYGTKIHIEAINNLGYSPIHRRSFDISKQLKLF
ncbi:MAG: ribonuclease HII [Candidatus Margulisbacteria bacterium GWF2_35_9]|nr:MAG: ribonuclease HII [Candidatus Margulisbacteria bacterium GWF2_35_9]